MTPMEFRKRISTSFMVALFFVATLFLFGPYRRFLNNITEFHVSFHKTCLYFIILAALVFFILFGIMLLSIKKLFHQKIVSFLFILSVLFWLYGNIISGTNLLINKGFGYELAEFFIWISVISAALYFSSFVYKYARGISILLIVTQIICLAYERINFHHTCSWIDKYLDTKSNSFYKYSKDKNVVILILDAFPSFIFQEIVDEDSSYKKIFDGFTYYRNSLSGYPNTKASIPNILTGEFYKNSEPFPDFTKNAYKNSLPKILSANGYQSNALESNGFICDYTAFSNYIPPDKSQEFWQEDAWTEFLMLNRITLFSHLPLFARKRSNLIFLSNDLFICDDGLKRMRSIVNNLQADNGSPAFKYYHLSSPHPPILFNEKLQYENLEPTRENFVRYAKGSLSLVKMFIDKLVESGICDNTLIFIISDHGYAWPTKKDGKYEALNIDVRALPLVLVKPFNACGDIKISDAPVHLQDITATTLAALSIKAKVPGESILGLDASTPRTRIYLQYTSINDSQKIMYMEPLKEYVVKGFSWLNTSWKATGKVFKPGYNYSESESELLITSDKFNINSPPDYVNRNSPTLFWEAGGGYPYWIKFDFGSKARKITKYSLKTGIHDGATKEMPKDWRFEGSPDGSTWVSLDARHGEVKWKKDEKRIYRFKNNKAYNYYRLYFERGNRPDYIRIYEILLKE